MMRALLLSLAIAGPLLSQEDHAFFEAEIRPLLIRRCAECHGPEEQEASLRLDDPAGIRAGGDFGAVVVPGDVAKSRLAQVIGYGDEHVQMPPKGKLPEAELAVLREWIARGAAMPEGDASLASDTFDLEARMGHWSFQPMQRPPIPGVEDQGWARATVDRFVLASLSEAALDPAAPATRIEWLRRVTFDLIGLPPTPDQVEAFLDDGDPGAHGRVVDRLLSSEDFGETWARHWLDLVRYAETKGHEFDYVIPNAWRYRDYVVRAFGADVPYDRFVLEHLAGDLLSEPRPNPDEGWDESPLGTGWWWLGEEMHSPVDIRADETNRIADQVDVFGKAFLGLTVACARCHDHKFDPISQRDYYALSGFVLSSPYRQVRFETQEHNAAVAAELRALRARSQGSVMRAVGEALVEELEGLEDVLRAGIQVLQAPPAQAEAPAAFLEDPENDLLVEDFEGADWGRWTAEGEAFGGERPPRVSELIESQRGCGAIGEGLLSSHAGWREGERVHSDELTGSLISPPILARRDYLHLLVGGGQHEGLTGVELWVDGELEAQLTGVNTNELRPARFDLSDHRGKEVEVRVVDQHKEGWGHTIVDHLVLSDREDAPFRDVRSRPSELYARHLAVQAAATDMDVEAGLVERAIGWLERAADADERNPLAVVGRVALGQEVAAVRAGLERGLPAPAVLPEGAIIRADYSTEGLTRWNTDGPLWLRRDAGEPSLLPGDRVPLHRVEPLGAAVVDSAWGGLRAVDSSKDTGRQGGDHAGRTLYTPSFELAGGRLFYLVRGRGRVYAAVDSHKLVQGPLHGRLVQDLNAADGYRWIQQDLTRYAGHRLHLEFSPSGADTDFAVAQVVEATRSPGGAWRPAPGWLGQEGDPSAVAADHLRRVARALEAGACAPADCASLGWLMDELWAEGMPPAVRTRTAAYREAEARARASARLESRVAPALMDGSGTDERLLARGMVRSAGEKVPRAFLTAVDGTPIQTPGSGRLELARRLVDPNNPLVSRAWVNRVWRHLFGRGLAPSVDDLGVMGRGPEERASLLDHLSRRFTGELAWSNKALLRELVLSSTYRQASQGHPLAEESDPDNALLHRMPVKTLTAEALRDAVLAVSGDLDRARFGKPVPIHLTDFLQGRGRPGNGPLDGNRRRSVYLAVRRNFLMPLLMVFDFPVPSMTRGERGRSNVPAQALTLLNDPFVHQQAERWAGRALEEHGELGDEQLVEALFQRALARRPDAAEREALAGLIQGSGDRNQGVTDLCHVLFNLKEFRHLR